MRMPVWPLRDVVLPAALAFGLTYIALPGQTSTSRQTATTATLRQEIKPVLLSEQLDVKTAERLLQEPSIDRGQRNEAANRLRTDRPDRLLQLTDAILRDDKETELFKSWMLQHVGVLAPRLPPTQADIWSKRLQDIVGNAPVGNPMWRESIFALSAFPQAEVHTWVTSYVDRLPAAEREANASILADVLAPRHPLVAPELPDDLVEEP